MLLSLHIENIAIAKNVNIDFKKGFNVLTGETGAGKSIIINSLALILGDKISRDIIRNDESEAMISALFGEFDDLLLEKFDELGLKIDENDKTILIQRNFNIEGKSSNRINGRAVNVSFLKEISKLLINIHGQHDSQNLLDQAKHIFYLDSFAQNETELAEYTELFDKANRIRSDIHKLSIDEKNKQITIDILKFQMKEIDSAKLKINEEEKLEELKKIIQNSEKIVNAVDTIESSLSGGENGYSALSCLKNANSAVKQVADFIPDSKIYIEKLENIISEIIDINALISKNRIDDIGNPSQRLDKIESRLDQIQRLKIKYGNNIEKILEFREEKAHELDNIIFKDEKIAKLKEELAAEIQKMNSAAKKLSTKRIQAAEVLEKKIMDELSFLDMSNVIFKVNIEKNFEGDGGVRYTPRGVDIVEFLIATNAGEQIKPLAKIASGGELSRIMLAMKSIFVKEEGTDTVVFDEIDTGISGKTAEKIGVKLRILSNGPQVICVTHSAQIASTANQHYLIKKSESDGRTQTHIYELNKEERIKETARILGGITITDKVMSTAAEMVEKNII